MLWAAVAVLGIVATATVAWGASQLATPGIGLSSEPPSVVSGLAPAAATTPAHPMDTRRPRVTRGGPLTRRVTPRTNRQRRA